jgi:hypothetical protein
MSLSQSKCWYSNNFTFFKCPVPLIIYCYKVCRLFHCNESYDFGLTKATAKLELLVL